MEKKINKQLDWLKSNKHILKISVIADSIGIPQRTLAAFVNDDRPLNEEWVQPLINWIEAFKK